MTERTAIEALAAEMGRALGEVEDRIFALETRLSETEAALCELVIGQEREISELRHRLADLEARHAGLPAPGPRLLPEAA